MAVPAAARAVPAAVTSSSWPKIVVFCFCYRDRIILRNCRIILIAFCARGARGGGGGKMRPASSGTESFAWMVALPKALDEVCSLEDLRELLCTPALNATLAGTGAVAALQAVAPVAGDETILLNVPTSYDGRWHRKQPRQLILTSSAIYRVQVPEAGAAGDASVCSRMELSAVNSVEAGAYAWILGLGRDDDERESTLTRLWHDHVTTPRQGSRFEAWYWLNMEEVDPGTANAWRGEVIRIVCAAIRAAVRLSLAAAADANEKISKLHGQRRWLEGGERSNVELEEKDRV